MNSLSIKRQVHLAVGCALLLLALLASLSYLATSKLSDVFDGYKETARQTLIANELLDDVADAQLEAFAYRLNPSEDQANEVWRLIDDIAKRQRQAEQTLALDDTALQQLRQVSILTEGYRDAFEQMTELNARGDRIAAVLWPIGSRIRANLAKIMNFASKSGDTSLAYDVAVAQQKFMRGRSQYKRFLLTNESKTFDSATAFMSAARIRIKAFIPNLNDPEMLKLADESISQVSTYSESAKENSELIKQRNKVRDNSLDVRGHKLRVQLDELLHSAVNNQKEMGARGADNAVATLFLVVLISIAALGAGGSLGVMVARHISESVRGVANAMAELASGNLDVVVTGTDQKHELGMMARALAVFKSHAEHLQRSLDSERELNGLQRQFVSMVSHEFRTPLAIIDGAAQRLERRPERITAERVLPVTRKIRTSILRLTELMESVLSVARMEEGRIRFEPAAVDLRAMITEICQNYAEINTVHQIDIDIDALPESYHGDVKLLRQAVSNLVSNALKYSPESTRVLVRGDVASNGGIVISVDDQGVGIPADELDRLFERFFRASTSTGIPGSGIGLHLVKHLVELHEGTMHVRSAVGQGTTFEIRLPAQDSASPQDGDVENLENATKFLNPEAA